MNSFPSLGINRLLRCYRKGPDTADLENTERYLDKNPQSPLFVKRRNIKTPSAIITAAGVNTFVRYADFPFSDLAQHPFYYQADAMSFQEASKILAKSDSLRFFFTFIQGLRSFYTTVPFLNKQLFSSFKEGYHPIFPDLSQYCRAFDIPNKGPQLQLGESGIKINEMDSVIRAEYINLVRYSLIFFEKHLNDSPENDFLNRIIQNIKIFRNRIENIYKKITMPMVDQRFFLEDERYIQGKKQGMDPFMQAGYIPPNWYRSMFVEEQEKQVDTVYYNFFGDRRMDVPSCRDKTGYWLDMLLAAYELNSNRGGSMAQFSKNNRIYLRQLQNPLLSMFEESIPQSLLEIHQNTRILLIHGLNTGGKSVLAQTILGNILRHNMGVAVTAEEASLPFGWSSEILPDYDSLKDIDMNDAGRLKEQIQHIFSVLQRDEKRVVFMDEPRPGTSPEVETEILHNFLQEVAKKSNLLLVLVTHNRDLIDAVSQDENLKSHVQFCQTEVSQEGRPTLTFKEGLFDKWDLHETWARQIMDEILHRMNIVRGAKE